MLNDRLLRQFIAVAEELHYGRAAQRVGIAQSPLSQAIQKLEAYLGVALFVRNKRMVALTPAGRVFLEDAYQWLKYEQVAVERVRSASHGEIGQLSVGFIGSAGYGFMPDLVSRFRQMHPRVRLRLTEMTTKDQLEQLKMRYFDAGLLRTPLPQDEPQIETWHYQSDRLMVALPKSHPLAGKKRIALRDLARESFAAFSREKVPAAHVQFVAACEAAGFYPNIEQECSQVASIICLVAAGVAVAVVASNLTWLMHPKVAYVPLDDRTLSQDIAIAWRRGNDNPVLGSFLEVARMVQTEAKTSA